MLEATGLRTSGLRELKERLEKAEAGEVAELRLTLERYEDCLRTVCHHLELPQSESGPCDDPSRYDRALEALLVDLATTEAERKLASERRFRAEAALQPFADAAKGLSDFWDDRRRAASISWDGLKVEHFRKARQALAVNSPADPITEGK